MIPKASVFALAKALEGVPILGTLSGSPAAKAGLRYGDVLLSVNGRRTRNVMDFIEAKALRQEGMQVVVFRGGAETTEELTYEARSAPIDPAALLAELVTMRIAPGVLDGDGGGGDVPLG